MKAIHARAVDVKKVPSRQVAVITLEVPIESRLAALELIDESDVLVTKAPKDFKLPYGVVDGDEGEAPEQEPPKEKPMGGELARLAGMLCANQIFQAFLSSQCPDYYISNEHLAASRVRVVCGIESRSELDSNPEAAERFHNLIRKPFLHWKDMMNGSNRS